MLDKDKAVPGRRTEIGSEPSAREVFAGVSKFSRLEKQVCGDQCKTGWFLLALAPSQIFEDSNSFNRHTSRFSDSQMLDGSCQGYLDLPIETSRAS